jgi:hypothetical protein
VEIEDWPSLPYRAVMVDMSHGPIVREEEVKRELDWVSRWKGNQYFFYTEASLQLDGYPLIRPGGQFTKDEVRRIIAHAKERHIDVVPNFDLFGHMHDLLRIEKYADLGHSPHGPELNPHDPRVKALLNDWIDQFCGVFTSPFVNIGFDETWQIERLARKLAVTPASLFLEQMNTVAGRFIQHGKTVLFWADQPIKYPEILDKLPKGAVPVVWTVEEGQGIKGRSIAPSLAHKLPHYLQRNADDWQNLTIDYMRTWKGIGECVALGRESGAEGMITAMWLDSSQHLERISLAAYAFGLSASWQSGPMDVPGFLDTYASVLYRPDVAREVASGMREMTQADVLIRNFTRGSLYEGVWFNPFSPQWMSRSRKHMKDLHQARMLAEGAEEHFYRALRAGADPYTLKSLLFGARWLDYAAARYQTPVEIEDLWNLLGPRIRDKDYWPYWTSEVTTQDHSRIVDMMDECTELREQFKTLWLEEYTPYRLGSTLGRWDAEYELWRAMQQKLQLFSPRPNEDKPSFQSVIK